jgi:Amt family ammonium transporter
MLSKLKTMMLALPLALLAAPAHAAVDSGDTAWMLISTALVLFMVPGLALFYAGMARSKNAVSTIYQNMIALGVVGVLWVVVGFSLAFSGDVNGFIGDTARVMFEGVGQAPDGTATIPFMLFAAFQMMFAIITPALMTGAFAERVNFKAWIAILIVWSLAVYAPIAHWVWTPTGWLAQKGALDFAGGYVVHMSAGFSALVAAIVFGKRRDFGQAMKPYSVAMVAIGTAILWFGWFGFNGGSALTSGGLATQAFMNTFISAAVAMLAWTLVDNAKDGKPTLMGGCIGTVAGLVAITPAAGFIAIEHAMLVGLLAGVLCNYAARMVRARGIDDSLDVFACHGVGGTLGILMLGLFGDKAVNGAGAMGYLNGGDLLTAQATGAVAVAVYSMVVTFIILKVVGAVMPLRVTDAEEMQGLDASQHGEQLN